MPAEIKELDFDLVDEFLQYDCPATEIAALLGIHEDTLDNYSLKKFKKTFSAYSKEKKLKGNAFIRKVQYEKAVLQKDLGMLIWLGKTRLKQHEVHPQELACQKDLEELNGTKSETAPFVPPSDTQD